MQSVFTVDGTTKAVERIAGDRLNAEVKSQQSKMFDLGEMDVSLDEITRTLWTYMAPKGSPNFSVNMLRDIMTIQSELRRLHGEIGSEASPKFLVLASKFPGVFNLGGDLSLFSSLIENRDQENLTDYALKCVKVFYENYISVDLPIVTIALVQGDALGGGFESALSFNVIIAERGSKFGLPEASFGLFPGMGAHAKLTRLLGSAQAERMILSGKTYTAEELHELGIVHVLADPGQGREVTERYIKRASGKHDGLTRTFRAMREINPITLDELERIVSIWVDAALGVAPHNLRLMHRLSAAQQKLWVNYSSAPTLAAVESA
jgi:DSF synthase